MNQKKIPLRMCLGCQEMKPKRELMRVVKNKEKDILLDLTGKKAGRGAYICKSVACFEKARKGKKFEKAFEMKIDEGVFDMLSRELEEFDAK